MMFGKKIQLFLVDGTANGRWICELSNWTGIAYKIPRNRVKESEARTELSSPGIYFLFGKDETKDRPLIYIGEAENTIVRLKQHLEKKDNWNEVIVFISKDSNLNKAHIKYLENRFHSIANECNRYSVDNSNTPTKTSISEAEQAELEEFIFNTKMLVNTLGHKVFEPYAEKTPTKNKEILFFVPVGQDKAMGTPTSDGFVLLKGSKIHQESSASLIIGLKNKVEAFRANKQIINNVLQEDILFSSSSTAAAFAVGYSISGPQQWKTSDGKTLKSFETEDKSKSQL